MASGLGVSQWRQGVRSVSHRVILHCTWTRLRHTRRSPGPKDGRRSLASPHPTARGRGAPDIPSNVSTLLPPRRAKATPRKGANGASVVGTARFFQIMAWCKWRDHPTLSPCYCCPSCCYPLPSYNEQPPPHCQSSSGHIHSIQEAGMPSASLLKIGRMKLLAAQQSAGLHADRKISLLARLKRTIDVSPRPPHLLCFPIFCGLGPQGMPI